MRLLLAISAFAVLFVIQEWLWRRTSRFLLYKGESRIRRGRSLAHFDSMLYAPEGHSWLTWYRLAYLATTIAFLVAFLTLASRWMGHPARQ
jgi:hypothetical protein